MVKLVLALLVSVCLTATTVSSDRILFLQPIATKSETHLLIPLAKGMLGRGHQVTIVSPATSHLKHKNLTEIIPVTPLTSADFLGGVDSVIEARKTKDDVTALLYIDMSYMFDRCHATYQHKDVQQVVIQAEAYDLVVTGAWFAECFLGLIHKLKAPYIMISSMPMPKLVMEQTGLRTPLSFVPNPFIELTHSMTLSQRVVNTLSSWTFTFLNECHLFKISDKIAKQYMGDDIPDVATLRKNVSMIFTNTHFSINYPRPLLPDIVEIGGVHCEPAKPLPKDLEEFVSGETNGFVLFSLGSVFKEETMPDHIIQIFSNVFSRLKQRVLWKWQSDIPGVSTNVKVSKWLPQADILGHPNIKLFISHGGLLSTHESTYHGVPILGIPLFVDQDVNMKTAEAHGYALKLELLDLTEEMLENAIHRMLNDTSFQKNAKRASDLFRDQPQTPLERGIYWMEYVMKHKGAPQLRSEARNLSYFQYHLYDVQLILLGIVGIIVFLVWKIISFLLCLSDEKSSSSELKKKYQ